MLDTMALDLSWAGIGSMERKHSIMSMTSHGDHREWQDVHAVLVNGLMIYAKFRANIVTEFRMLSFMEREGS